MWLRWQVLKFRSQSSKVWGLPESLGAWSRSKESRLVRRWQMTTGIYMSQMTTGIHMVVMKGNKFVPRGHLPWHQKKVHDPCKLELEEQTHWNQPVPAPLSPHCSGVGRMPMSTHLQGVLLGLSFAENNHLLWLIKHLPPIRFCVQHLVYIIHLVHTTVL